MAATSSPAATASADAAADADAIAAAFREAAPAPVEAPAVASVEAPARTSDRRLIAEQAPRRQGARLLMLNPMPRRVLLLLGTEGDTNLVSLNEATEQYDGLCDGHYEFDETQNCLGFLFRQAVLVTLIFDESEDQ